MNKIAINDIGTPEDFLRAIDESMKDFTIGDMARGTVVQIDRDGVLVDIGYKTEAHIPKKQMTSRREFDVYDIVSIGQVIEATVIGKDEEGQLTLSLKEAEAEQFWNTLETMYEAGMPVSGIVSKIVKGGLIVDIGVRSFLPASLFHIDRTQDFTKAIGTEVEALITEFNREKGNIVISRKALIEKEQGNDKKSQFDSLEIGQFYDAKVSGVTNYGVFAQVGLLSGLVHQSKMQGYTPEQFIIGQDITVKVIELDAEKDRLSLAIQG